jgi:hypothetical protein
VVERERAARTASREDGRGYFKLQSTRPQTVGYALADSPVGLLAWMSEKLVDWTDAYPWEDDERMRVSATYPAEADAQAAGPPVRAVLDWVMIYWLSRAGPAASLRTYYEYAHASPAEKALLMRPLALPFGMSLFPKELSQPPLACV